MRELIRAENASATAPPDIADRTTSTEFSGGLRPAAFISNAAPSASVRTVPRLIAASSSSTSWVEFIE
jgi:hypothetical protein